MYENLNKLIFQGENVLDNSDIDEDLTEKVYENLENLEGEKIEMPK